MDNLYEHTFSFESQKNVVINEYYYYINIFLIIQVIYKNLMWSLW